MNELFYGKTYEKQHTIQTSYTWLITSVLNITSVFSHTE